MYPRELSNFSRLFYSLSGGSEGKLHFAPRGSVDPRRARRKPEWATEPGSAPAGGRRETLASRNVRRPGAVIWDAEKSREEDWWGFRERSAYRHLLFEIFLVASGKIPRCTQVLSPSLLARSRSQLLPTADLRWPTQQRCRKEHKPACANTPRFLGITECVRVGVFLSEKYHPNALARRERRRSLGEFSVWISSKTSDK